MLLGVPQTTYQGSVWKLSPMARSSDHFGELDGTGIKADHVRRALDALIESGYVQEVNRPLRDIPGTYSAVKITQKGRDVLAGGIDLPAFQDTEVLHE